MKTKLLIAAMALFISFAVSAQYCGTSGFICAHDSSITTAGVFDNANIPCIVRGQASDVVLHFKNYDTLNLHVPMQGNNVHSLRFDSIKGLPSGMCWSTDKVDNMYDEKEYGCVRFTGITNAPAGQYKLKVHNRVGLRVGLVWYYNVDTIVDIYLRVIDMGDPCPVIDTSLTNPTDTGTALSGLVQISGKVYYDFNLNDAYDAGEAGIANQLISIGGYSALTNATGDYLAYSNAGTYTAKLVAGGQAAGFPHTPDSIIINAGMIGALYSGNNFGVSVPTGYCSGVISSSSNFPCPRPGFINYVRVRFRNNISDGGSSQNVRFNYDSLQSYVSATPAPTVIDTIARYVEWATGTVNMGSTWQAEVRMYTYTTTTLGQIATYVTEVAGASCAGFDTLSHVNEEQIKASLDPNDKAVSPVGYGAWGGVNPDLNPVFTYKVRFQNTGNFYAENVLIVDTISQHLDLNTLQVLSSSHDYKVTMEDNRAVKFWFTGIMLPDSNANEPASHGDIVYSIRPYTGLAQDVAITNRADIYFDFNLPVLTNTTLTTIDYVDHTVGIREVNAGYSFTLFPNPANNNVQISADEELIGQELVLTDISGRLMLHQTIKETTTTLNVSNIAKGIYLVRMGAAIRKLVKE